MRFQKISAVDSVARQGAIGLAEALRWFYVEVAGLEEVNPDHNPDPRPDPCPDQLTCRLDDLSVEEGLLSALRFRTGQQVVRIDLVPNPDIESNGFPIVISVPSLEEAGELLDARSVAYETISGISWPDRRLSTSDPAGNRVELKREWPYDPL